MMVLLKRTKILVLILIVIITNQHVFTWKRSSAIWFRKGHFEKDPDGSVWIDLTADGLDRKIKISF